MLKENLKKEIDKLNEEQLLKVADFIAFIEFQARRDKPEVPFWQNLTPQERSSEFRRWVSQLPESGVSLPDEATSRDSIYEE
jgi:hypothetical protein